jgi:hypothetical protein
MLPVSNDQGVPKSLNDLSLWTALFKHQDHIDAYICSLIAWLFSFQPTELAHPDAGIPINEGWIFFPKDGVIPPFLEGFLGGITIPRQRCHPGSVQFVGTGIDLLVQLVGLDSDLQSLFWRPLKLPGPALTD